jgi:predicted acyl esterase
LPSDIIAHARMPPVHRRPAALLALPTALLLLVASGCNDDASGGSKATDEATAPVTAAPTTTAPATTTIAAAPATFTVQPGTNQLAVLGAAHGTRLELVADDGSVTAKGEADAQGSLLFRQIDPGSYTVRSTGPSPQASKSVEVASPDDVPPASFFSGQHLTAPGFGYLTTRDGTTLSANVVLPGPIDKGPYPTVVEYSGYSPSDPGDTTFSQLFTALGFAYVGVNIRGTGCSGGSFQFFEPAQSQDGYDMIEAIAAQPWVAGHEVGMVGISYPGIAQLFVAQTRPPHLAAITPLSVLDDSFRSTLYPGGILNTGFAVPWTQERQEQAKPNGQAWAAARVEAGDTTCAANQKLRLQNPDLTQMIDDHPYYDPAIADVIAPTTFVDKIDVPVYLAGAWQDEQTGGHFPAMLDKFTSSPHLSATMVNGTHVESLASAAIFNRYVVFLDLYVAHKAPDLGAAGLVWNLLAGSITGVSDVALPPSGYEGLSYEQALAKFESQPPVRVLFEEGAADGTPAGSPVPRYEADFDQWPVASAVATPWYLGAAGTLTAAPPTAAAGGAEAMTTYVSDPSAVPATDYTGSSSEIWSAAPAYDWRTIPTADRASFLTAPLAKDTVVVGPGSVDLWLRSSAPDTDLEVTLSEVRPDGNEVYVQSGWLRASHRALDEAASTELRPVHTDLEADAAPLPAGELTPVRVELFPSAHAFRAGSRIRLTVHAPGGDRPTWAFATTISKGETNDLAHDVDHPSRLVLPVVSGVAVPAAAPACGALRGQPCRPYVAG